MLEPWSRRKFLEAGVVATISAGCTLRRSASTVPRSTWTLASDERETLLVAMDELIPATDGMPSASHAGCLEYLDRLTATQEQVRTELRDALRRLNALAQSSQEREFARLPSEQRVGLLAAFESRASVAAFATLRDLVYEAYYTQPRVWKLIGFEFYPPERPGPLPPPFDDAVLARVQQMPKLYREVS